MSRGIKLTAVLCGSLIVSQADIQGAYADTVFWQGANSANWFNDANWIWDGHVPTSSDEARIDTPSVYNPVISTTGAAAGTLLIGLTGNGSLMVSGTGAAADLTTGTTSLGFSAGSTGGLVVIGAQAEWNNTGSAYVGEAGTGTISIENGAQSTIGDSLYIGAGAGSGTVYVQSGADLDVTNTLFVGYSSSTSTSELKITSATVSSGAASIADGLGAKGDALVTGAGAKWTNTGLMTVGGGGVGSLTISDGGVVETGSAGIGAQLQASGSSIKVDGTGSKFTATGDLFIGNFGNATLRVENGGEANSAHSIIARLAGSTSSATVTGTSSVWNAGDLRVGGYDGSISNFGGNGTLNVEAGGKVSTTAVSIADVAGATGKVTVKGGNSLLESTGRIFVGRAGQGELTIEDTAQVSSVGANFANEAGSTATVTITGVGSGWTSTGNVHAGNLGNATLKILAGGSLSGVDGYVGTEAGSNSSATIDGAGSIWTNSGDFFVGHNAGSIGEVTVSEGGKITSLQGLLGDLAGSSGKMTVTGTSSEWQTTGDLNVGRFGHGEMTISDGGKVTSSRSYLGNESGSDGSVLITGAGSNWTTTTGGLFVGADGNGELTLANGGSVTASEVVIANGAGSVSTLNIGAARGATAALAGTVDSSTVRFGDGTGSLVFNFSDPTLTFASSILGNGSLHLAGNTLTLTGANSYTGGTTVGGGTLIVGSEYSLPLFSDVSISAGATLDLNGYGASLHSLTGEGTLETGSQGAIYLYHGGTFAGSITGANAPWPGPAAFVFSAPGETLTLSGNSNFGGYFSANAGTVVSTGNSTFGGLAFWGGTFEVDGGNTTLDSYIIVNGTAATPEITVSGGGALTITDGLYLANFAGNGGEVVVTGAGSALNVLGELYVAYDGVGQLKVSGGSVSINGGTGDIELAAGSNGSGTLVIGGAAGAPASAPGVVKASSIGASGGSGTVVFNHNAAGYYFTSTGTASGVPVTITENIDPSAGGTGVTSVVHEAGTTYFLADNDYTGTTTINGGALVLGNGGMSGSIVGPAIINAGASLQFNRADDVTYAGKLSGTGALIKTGVGELDYTGNGSAFTGTTTVSAGRLAVNGTLGGAVNVLSGGALGGNGATGSLTLLSGSTVAPGNSIGTLTVNGDVTFSPGSTYEVELAGNGTSDLIAATDRAFVNGGTVELTAIDPQTSYQTARTYTILTAAGGVFGAFDAAISNSPFLVVSVEDLLNGVGLTIAVKSPNGFASAAITPNQFATAAALDGLAQSGAPLALYNSLLFLPSANEARHAFDQLSGEVHASAQSVFMEQSSLIRGALVDRLRAAQGGVGASAGTVVNVVETSTGALAYAAPSKMQVAADLSMPVKAVPVVTPVERFSLWTTGFGNWGSFDGNGNASGINDSTGGFLIGADTLVGSGWRVGIAGGYSYSDFSSAGRNASGSSDNWHAGLYAGNVWGQLALRTGLSYTWQDVSTSRQVAFTGFFDSLSADYDTGTFQAFGELGWRIETAFASFEPFANLAYVSLDTSGYFEQGGAAALFSDGSDMDTTFSTLGLRASKEIALGSYEATLRGLIGWRHAFGDVTPSITQAFLTSDAFTVTGVPIAEDAAVIEAGLDVRVGEATTLGIAYTGQFGGGVTQNGFNASLSVKF